ncbi:LysM domain-containing protein [Frankineae bacterium MT45]|nr:LysM domain-containing protein [Frankineae bacterium MT45]
MSAATELPPVVCIPERARVRVRPNALRAVPPTSTGRAQPCRTPVVTPRRRVAVVTRPEVSAFVEVGEQFRPAPVADPVEVREERPLGESMPLVANRPPLAVESVGQVDAGMLRLTARGRVVLLLAGLVLSVAFLLAAHAGAGASSARPAVHQPVGVPASTVVVHDGDTLWSIATRVDPTGDPRNAVERLRRLNGLSNLTLIPGQTIRTR